MNEIFDLVYKFLKWISFVTGFTYREVNIVVYFIIIPSFFFYLISRILKKSYPIITFIILTIITIMIIPNFERFSDKLFDKSVDFLNWFKIIGLNYIHASVVICVIIPIIAISLLLFYKIKINRNINAH